MEGRVSRDLTAPIDVVEATKVSQDDIPTYEPGLCSEPDNYDGEKDIEWYYGKNHGDPRQKIYLGYAPLYHGATLNYEVWRAIYSGRLAAR